MNKRERAIAGAVGALVGSVVTLTTQWVIRRFFSGEKTETKTEKKHERHQAA